MDHNPWVGRAAVEAWDPPLLRHMGRGEALDNVFKVRPC